jgi:DnaJ domain
LYESSTANSRREFWTETRKSGSGAGMKTLYDLLGALPKDDAEGLRTAFRQAVKGAHPDIHPGDPDAALKFREIVRANEILGDVEQRAAYDHLLDLARLEQESASARATAARIHKFASGTIAFAGASIVTVGGYLLFMHMSVASIAPANQADVTMRASAEIAAVSPAGSSDTTGKSTSLAKREGASVPGPAIAPSAAMPPAAVENLPAANVGPPLDLTASNARSSRARGVSASRKRDLNGGNIFDHLREFGRAFADIPPAKRLEKPGRTKSASATAGKQRVDQARIASSVAPVSRQRTAAQDPSREEGVATVRLP